MSDRIIIYNIPNTKQKRYCLKSPHSQTTTNQEYNRTIACDAAMTKCTDTKALPPKKKKASKCNVNKVCVAEDHLIHLIQQINFHRHHFDYDELMDMPKNKIKSLPFYIHKNQNKIVLITSPAESDAAVVSIRKELELDAETDSYDTTTTTTYAYLGLDTETRPKFHKGDPYPPALMQIATSTTAYLFRLTYDNKLYKQKCPMTKSLHALLADPSIIKIGVGIHKDIVDMKQFYGVKCCGDGSSYPSHCQHSVAKLEKKRITSFNCNSIAFSTKQERTNGRLGKGSVYT